MSIIRGRGRRKSDKFVIWRNVLKYSKGRGRKSTQLSIISGWTLFRLKSENQIKKDFFFYFFFQQWIHANCVNYLSALRGPSNEWRIPLEKTKSRKFCVSPTVFSYKRKRKWKRKRFYWSSQRAHLQTVSLQVVAGLKPRADLIWSYATFYTTLKIRKHFFFFQRRRLWPRRRRKISLKFSSRFRVAVTNLRNGPCYNLSLNERLVG